MSILKRRLNRVLHFGDAVLPEERTSKPNFSELQNLRSKIKQHLGLTVSQFCRTKPAFDIKHGLVYKILKTDPKRLRNSTLCSHDVSFWLKDHKHPSAALWVVKLAGPQYGQVSRNQLLQWLRSNDHADAMQTVYKWTKKWGFKDSERTKSIVSHPQTVNEARDMYKNADMKSPSSKRMYGNKLLSEIVQLQNIEAEEIWAFFKMLNKDVITFQIMLAAMIKANGLRVYLDEVWDLAERHERANNIKIDDKLRETYARVKTLAKSGKAEQPTQRGAAAVEPSLP